MAKEKHYKNGLSPRDKELLDFLCLNAVGYEKRVSAKTIMEYMFDYFKNRQAVEESIQKLRVYQPRKIGSSTSGYWMECSDDKVSGDAYMVNQVVGKMDVAIRSGVNPKLFYKKLNEIAKKYDKAVDLQQIFDYDSEELTDLRRFNDDLRLEQ